MVTLLTLATLLGYNTAVADVTDFGKLITRLATQAEVDAKVKQGKELYGNVWYSVADTPSMLGSGINNSMVRLMALPEYKKDDLVVVRGNDKLIIHPVTATDPKRGVYTKGTFNQVGDGWTDLSQVLGRVIEGYKVGESMK